MYLLVVGTPRSGTTLLTCLIGSHPRCIAMSECLWGEEHKIVSPSEVVVNKLCTPNQIQFEHPPLPTLLQRIGVRFQKELARLTGLWMKDWPLGALSIRDYVAERDARLLFIVRDPNQVIDSMIRRSGQSESRALSRWAHGIQEMHASYSEYSQRCHLLAFSDLVLEPENELRKICEFINLEYSSDMMNGYRYSPQYNRDKISESVLNKNTKNYRIEERCERSYEKYDFLKSI